MKMVFATWWSVGLLLTPWRAVGMMPLFALYYKKASLSEDELPVVKRTRCWSWSSNTLATWCEEPTHWKRPWCWEDWRQEEKRVTEDKMARWHHFSRTWVGVNSGRQRRTEEPGVPQSMGWQRLGHDLATEQQQSLPPGQCSHALAQGA